MNSFEELVKKITDEFNDAWNNWELEKLEIFMCPNLIIHSPMIQVVYPEHDSNKLIGSKNVIQYWKKLKSIKGDFKVEQESFQKDDIFIKVVNKVIGTETRIMETMILNEYGKIKELHYEYVGEVL